MELEMEFETEKDRIGKQEGVNKRLHGVAGTLLIYIYIYIYIKYIIFMNMYIRWGW